MVSPAATSGPNAMMGSSRTSLICRLKSRALGLGDQLLGLRKHEESIVALECAVGLNPNCSLAYGSLGTLCEVAGRTNEAIANQQIAIRSNPRDQPNAKLVFPVERVLTKAVARVNSPEDALVFTHADAKPALECPPHPL